MSHHRGPAAPLPPMVERRAGGEGRTEQDRLAMLVPSVLEMCTRLTGAFRENEVRMEKLATRRQV